MKRSILNAKHLRILLSILLFGSVVTCSEVIELGGDPSQQFILVYGRITDGIAGNEINISRTSDRVDGPQQPVSGATVSLLNEGNVLAQYREMPSSPGDYRLQYTDSAREGRSYQISILLPNGEQILSEPAIMPGIVARDSLYIEVDIIDVIISEQGFRRPTRASQLFVDTHILDQEKDFYLRWNLIETYTTAQTPTCCGDPPPPCYITNDISGQDIRLFNGADLKPELIPKQRFVNTVIDARFAYIYYYSVVQSTIDEQAYTYWSELDEIANLSGYVFDKTVANIAGNLYYPDDAKKQVFGYFEVAHVDTARVSNDSDQFEFFLREPCPAAPENFAPECSNCLLIENSSHHRPYFYR